MNNRRRDLDNTDEQSSTYQNDMQILKKHYQFVRNSEGDETDEYGENLAKEYESKLFRDYAIADLSKYKEGKIGLRWRNESEVIKHKGHFICAALNCEQKEELQSSLLNFSYKENGETKQCLVKVCLCPSCFRKLEKINKKRKKEQKKLLKEEKKKKLKKELKLLSKVLEKEKKKELND